MATKTPKYELQKKEDNDFYNIEDLNANWDKVENALTEFDDSGTAEGITSFTDMLAKLVTGNKLAVTLRNLKAGLQFVLHTGSIVNNCVTDNAKLPLSAAQGKVLQDAITKLNGERFSVPESYFRDNINKTYSSVEVLIFGYLVIMRISILIDNFTDYFGEVTDDIRRIPALKELAPKEIRAPGIIRSADNTKTQGHIGSLMYDGNSGKIYANIYACGTETRPASVTSGYVIGQLITYLKW